MAAACAAAIATGEQYGDAPLRLGADPVLLMTDDDDDDDDCGPVIGNKPSIKGSLSVVDNP